MPGSCSQYSSMSLLDRSALFPTETNDDRPTPRRSAASMIAIPMPPLCDRNPTAAGDDMSRCERGVQANLWRRVNDPRQFGPTIRMPASRHTRSSSCCRPPPLSPVSANPAEITNKARTPTLAHSRATPTTRSAGTTITARSTDPGTSLDRPVRGKRLDHVLVALTAYRGPRTGREQIAQGSRRPTVPRRPRRADHRQ